MARFANAPVDRAAGGVVLGADDDGPLVLVVHRRRHDDWSLPKGHVESGESWLEAALREVREETGVVATAQPGPRPVAYMLPDGRPKVVLFFVMKADSVGEVATPDEVDAVEWWPLDRAGRDLSYEVERRLVTEVSGLRA